jgi:hypothetical protein
MTYKTMVQEARQAGRASETAMWASIEAVDDMLEEMREQHPEKYWKFMRKAHEQLWGSHYDMQFANHDISRMHSTDANGREQVGAHWTREEVAQAWAGRTFPQSTTDCDKWVAANAFWHDLRKNFEDAEILQAAFLFFFADEDWKRDGKVWEYMNK